MSTGLPLRDRIIPWYFVMFFSVIIAVNLVMAHFAYKTRPGLVTDHPYEKGIAYNKIVAAEEQQEKLGWKADIEYRDGALLFRLQDRHQQALKPEKVTASFYRPQHDGMDFDVALTGDKTPVKLPAPGLWEVRVDGTYQGTHYQQHKRIVAP